MDGQVLRRIAIDDAHAEALRALCLRSGITAPMIARGRTIGALTLASRTRTYGHGDVWLVEQLAQLAASAIDSARLHDADGRAARRVDRLLKMVAALSRASTAA